MREALKVSVSGVRGVVGKSFSPQIAARFAQAFGTFVGRGAVVVGRDTRPSGPMIEAAVVAGLQSVGCKPILAGIAPTPTVLYLTKIQGARGGIAITASHNPSEWNALKFVDRFGLFLKETRAEELFDIYHQQAFPLVEEGDLLPKTVQDFPVQAHFDRILEYVDSDRIRKRNFKVAVDCCNGVGALYSEAFLRIGLGCEVVPVLDKPTGAFEREPEPLPENLGTLCEAVVREQCDIGFAQDPDGDRVAIVNNLGEPIGEDLSLTFALQQVLAAHGKGLVAVNLSSSKSVEYVAGQQGCKVIRTKIGEINVSTAMLERGAVVGGENSGGVIIPAVHPCRDSFVGMAIVLEMMAQSDKTIAELRDNIPRYYVAKGKIPTRSDQTPVVLRALRRIYAQHEVNLLDGIHIDFGDSWIHVRRSNTEPVIRVMAEALTEEESTRLYRELQDHVEDAL